MVGFGALLTVAKKWKIFLAVGLVLCLLGLIFAIVGGVEINKHKDDLKSENAGFIVLAVFGAIFLVLGIVITVGTLYIKKKKDSMFPGLTS